MHRGYIKLLHNYLKSPISVVVGMPQEGTYGSINWQIVVHPLYSLDLTYPLLLWLLTLCTDHTASPTYHQLAILSPGSPHPLTTTTTTTFQHPAHTFLQLILKHCIISLGYRHSTYLYSLGSFSICIGFIRNRILVNTQYSPFIEYQ